MTTKLERKERHRQIAAYAKERGHELLSKEYVNNTAPLVLRCEAGHEWSTTWNMYSDQRRSAGRGCRVCHGSLGERTVRELLRSFFGKSFPSVQPAWLRNPKTGKRLQLDCFSEELGLAVEHQGDQHYQEVPNFSVDGPKLRAIRANDRRKRRLCAERGVILVHIRERDTRGPIEDVRERLAKRLSRRGVVLPDGWRDRPVDLAAIGAAPALARWKKLKAYAAERRGVLLSGVGEVPRFRCEHGHSWPSELWTALRGRHWCLECSKHAPITRERMLAWLRDRAPEWTLVSHSVDTVKQQLVWRCSAGHTVRRSFHKLQQRGPTCQKCRHEDSLRGTLEAHQARLPSHLRCVSSAWLGSGLRHDYRCERCAHEWSAIANNVQRAGYDCPECARASGSAKRRLGAAAVDRALSAQGFRLVGPYVSRHALVDVTCVHCGTSRSARYGNLVQGRSRCPCRRGLRRDGEQVALQYVAQRATVDVSAGL
jgi:hypothetical protein